MEEEDKENGNVDDRGRRRSRNRWRSTKFKYRKMKTSMAMIASSYYPVQMKTVRHKDSWVQLWLKAVFFTRLASCTYLWRGGHKILKMSTPLSRCRRYHTKLLKDKFKRIGEGAHLCRLFQLALKYICTWNCNKIITYKIVIAISPL